MSANISIKYRCEECSELHHFKDDASTCCPPHVSTVYVCHDCGDAHREQKNAEACCSDVPEDQRQTAIILTHKQLEAAGQLRLIR